MIKITSQDGRHQYDEFGNVITTWDSKKCAWIVDSEFDSQKIDWWGEDNDFPAGYTLSEYLQSYPNWDKVPDIYVTWTWADKDSMIKAFGRPSTLKESDWYDKRIFPYSESRSWGYIDEPEEYAIERLGRYCDFHKFASNVKVIYNGKEIFNGKLE